MQMQTLCRAVKISITTSYSTSVKNFYRGLAEVFIPSPFRDYVHESNHSMQHMTVCGLSLHQGNTESRKTLEQKFTFQIGTLNPDGINERFSFN